MKNKVRAETLGKLHSKLWRYHDEQKWNKLNKTTKSFLKILGYCETEIQLAMPNIVNTFKEADLAYLNQKKENKKEEELHYHKMLKYFNKAYKALNVKITPTKYKIKWIKASRHKNHFAVLFYLFLEYSNLFGTLNPFIAIRATQISITKVYPAHNKHNWKQLENALSEFWQVIINNYKNKKTLPPQF